LGVPVPELMANGENQGIQHSFSIETDAFAQGDTRLINYKKYYFMVLAYGYNNYREFDPVLGQGQDVQYKASRKSATGSIRVYCGIPHPPVSESGGTATQSQYGDGIALTRIEGKGNGNNLLSLSAESEDDIVNNYSAAEVTYQPGFGPVDVKVIDPLSIKAGDFELQLNPNDEDLEEPQDVFWTLTNLTMLNDNDPNNDDDAVYESIQSIQLLNEEILLDWGISVSWQQTAASGPTGTFIDLLDSRIVFEDESYPWLQGLPDRDENSELNWIRSGNVEASDDSPEEEVVFNDAFDTTTSPDVARDGDEIYEGVVGGTWAPYVLVSYTADVTFQGANSSVQFPLVAPTTEELRGPVSNLYSTIEGVHNVDVVFTSDRNQWTRCAVLEMQPNADLAQDADGNDDVDPEKMRLRRHPSVDKNGLWNSSQEGYNQDEATAGGAQPIGMGWFPGYAIDLGTGERLNMAFGEDSWLAQDNGDDMLYNPSSRIQSNLGGQVFGGGQHWVYVFKNSMKEEENDSRMPGYDEGAYLYDALEGNFSTTQQRRVFRACTWVGSSVVNDDYPMLDAKEGLIPTKTRVELRVQKPYRKYSPSELILDSVSTSLNNWNPLYQFSTKGLEVSTSETDMLADALSEINVVPNPYYAYSEYEESKLDNRVKFINLPEECTINIYTVNGTLIRQFRKSDPLTFLDWDLKNDRNVPISGGVYIVHIDAPGVGEKVLKFFGIMRPTDLDNF
ncbi:MAG: hypothetical protein AAF193_03365, partial [Bacteroidota bacterium]